jgi:drug/metabolite transporter (DMT)-like permease
MSDLGLNITFEIYFLAGTIYLFFSPKDWQLARLRAARPEWSEDFVHQFFIVSRLVMVGATIFFTYHLLQSLRGRVR